MGERKIPRRMCVACREMKEKRELVRAVRSKDGEISIDLTGKSAGRGAYICRKSECLSKAQKSRALERAFGCAISPEVYERLKEQLSEANDEK